MGYQMNCIKHGGRGHSKADCYDCWLGEIKLPSETEKEQAKADEQQAKVDKYDQGYRFVMVPQSFSFDRMEFYKSSTVKAPWAHGLYELLDDGSLGDCLSYNFDSSD